MSGKQIPIGSKPSDNSQEQGELNFATETWVESRQVSKSAGQMKRLTIDIPAKLHRRIKTQCASQGKKMSDEIRAILLDKYDAVDLN